MYTGGLQKVTITRQDDHTAAIMFGEDKLLEIEFDRDKKILTGSGEHRNLFEA